MIFYQCNECKAELIGYVRFLRHKASKTHKKQVMTNLRRALAEGKVKI